MQKVQYEVIAETFHDGAYRWPGEIVDGRPGLAGPLKQIGKPEKPAKEPEATPPSGDDLTKIKGIGVATTKRLRDLGVNTYADLAGLSEERIVEIDKALGTQGAAQIRAWAEQAKTLAG